MIREKIIFDGIIEGSPNEILRQMDLFYLNNNIFGFDINVSLEIDGSRYIEKIVNENGTEILNGYHDMTSLSINQEKPCKLKIVSCRDVLDIIYFQLSQYIQAKFMIPDFPPSLLSIPLKDLYNEGVILKQDILPNDENIIFPNIDDIPKYGVDRDLSTKDVKKHVNRCRSFMKRGGTIRAYHTEYLQEKCEFETFRKWMINPKFSSNT